MTIARATIEDRSRLRGMPKWLGRISTAFRRRRLARFSAIFPPGSFQTAIDLGGSTQHWMLLGGDARVTIVNRDSDEMDEASLGASGGIADGPGARTRYRFVVGDACATGMPDGAFDLAFSNSVIEHVGDFDAQRRFASEMMRVGRGIWCQTPNPRFFFETHLMTVLLHWLPRRWQGPLVRRFSLWGWIHRPDRATAEAYLDMTRLLTHGELEEIFPGCEILTEHFLGAVKSFIVLRRGDCAAV